MTAKEKPWLDGDQNRGMCISYYQIARSWNIPYGTTKRLFRAGLQGPECSTTTGASGIKESQLKQFRETFTIIQTKTGRWVLKPQAQLTLF